MLLFFNQPVFLFCICLCMSFQGIKVWLTDTLPQISFYAFFKDSDVFAQYAADQILF